MIFSKKTIRTTSIPKLRKIHSGVWKLYAQNSQTGLKWTKFLYSIAKTSPYQNLARTGIFAMVFSKKTTRVVSIPKIMKMYSGVWKI